MSATMTARATARITPQEYLTLEKEATIRHEYFEGEVIEMAGGTPQHTAIITDTQTTLAVAVRGTEFEIYTSEVKVRVADDGPFFYPDVTVLSAKPVFDRDDCLRNPYAIVEVLSESTAAYDRDGKFRAYRRLSSLRHYVLIAQGEVRVEHFERLPGDVWALVGEHEQLTETLIFADSEIAVPLTEIYRRVPFPEG